MKSSLILINYNINETSKFLEGISKRETCRFRQTMRRNAMRNDRIISSKRDVRGGFHPGYDIRIKRVPFFFRCSGKWFARPGLRGHGPDDVIRIRECYSDADVRISPSKVSRVPFFKGISTSPWLYFAYHLHAIAATHIGEHFSTSPPPYLYSNHSGHVLVHFAHPDCATLSALISVPFIFPGWEWKK